MLQTRLESTMSNLCFGLLIPFRSCEDYSSSLPDESPAVKEASALGVFVQNYLYSVILYFFIGTEYAFAHTWLNSNCGWVFPIADTPYEF